MKFFPPVQRSEIEKRCEEKRLAFLKSREDLVGHVRQKAHPYVFFAQNSKSIFLSIAGLLAGAKFVSKFSKSDTPDKKISFKKSFMKAGLAWELVRIGAGIILKRRGKNPDKAPRGLFEQIIQHFLL